MDRLILFIICISCFIFYSRLLDKKFIKENRRDFDCDDTCVHRCDVNCLYCKSAGFWKHQHDKDFKGGE